MAAFNMLATFRQKNLTCGVCQEIYRSPRLLPCHHSFCLHCIEGLANSNGRVFPCPVCRKPTQVPSGGVRVFQSNFYITEEELQLARNNTESALCPTHSTEPVIFLCKECDQAICIRCKLLKHNQHDCEDLSEAASRCKTRLTAGERRLQGTIGHLTKQLHLAEDNVKSAQEKRVVLKEQVKSQRDMLIARVNKWHDEAIKNVDNVADTVEEQLQAEVEHVRHELDSLTPLTQRVQHALGDACDADVVSCEKEMRIGMGSKDELVRVESEARITIVRPGLHCDIGSVTDDDIKRAIGAAVTLTTPHLGPTETITKVFCCAENGKRHEVHSLCPLGTAGTRVSCGGMPPDYKEEIKMSFNDNGEKTKNALLNGRVSYKRYGQHSDYFRSSYSYGHEKRLHSKSATMFQLVRYGKQNSCYVYTTAIKSRHPMCMKKERLFTLNASNPLSFDVSSNGAIFVVLDEGEELVETKYSQYSTSGTSLPKSEETETGENREEAMDTGQSQSDQTEHAYSRSSARCGATRRQVLLYRPNSYFPICVYTPPEATFFPSDVCFWTVRGEEKLLVADWMNDAVHLVRFDDTGACHFERYLAAGHGDLVKPSALNTDSQGRLWIGCSNGWVLRSEELKAEEDSMRRDITASDDLASTEAEVGLEPDMFLDSDQEQSRTTGIHDSQHTQNSSTPT